MPESILGPFLTAITVGLYGLLHSILARPAVKKKAYDAFGENGRRYYRIMYNLIGGVTFLPVLFVVALYPGQTLYRLPWPWSLLFALVQLGAIILLLVGLLQTDILQFLGLRQSVGSGEDQNGSLAIDGLYRWVRHPLYTAGLLFIWFTPVMTTSVLLMNLSITVYIYIGSIFEEQRLVDEFGEAYIKYQDTVPRLLPRPPQRKAI